MNESSDQDKAERQAKEHRLLPEGRLLRSELLREPVRLSDDDIQEDSLIKFFVESLSEKSEVCANCDQVSDCMVFCETCQQALCMDCKQATHQAKMFQCHKISIPAEERIKSGAVRKCGKHGEPLILFRADNKSLACIMCFLQAKAESRVHFLDLDDAYCRTLKKLSKLLEGSTSFQNEVNDSIHLHNVLLDETKKNASMEIAALKSLCQQMVDKLYEVRDSLVACTEKKCREKEGYAQKNLRVLQALNPTADLYKVIASLLCSSASKVDFLYHAHQLMDRVKSLTVEYHRIRPAFTSQCQINFKAEYAKALEPFLGMKSVLLPSIEPQLSEEIVLTSSYSFTSEYSPPESSSSGNYSGESCISSSKRSVFSQELSRFILMADLAGAFGEEFQKISDELKTNTREFAAIVHLAQELQRDITTRKRLIDAKSLDELKHQCQKLKIDLGAHTTAVDDLHPKFQQIWEEQLDRVRRQQEMYKNHITSVMCLRQNLQHLITAISQLSPYVKSITQVIQHVFPHRLQCEELGPMQRICNQICTLEPNSQHRVDAIEKQEQSRKEEMERKKLQSGKVLAKAKKHLKTPKDAQRRKTVADESADSMNSSRSGLFRCVDRERDVAEELTSRKCKSVKPHPRDGRKLEGLFDGTTPVSGCPGDVPDSLDSSFEYLLAVAERSSCSEQFPSSSDQSPDKNKRRSAPAATSLLSGEFAENANCQFSFQLPPLGCSVSSSVNYYEKCKCSLLDLCMEGLCSSVKENPFMNDAFLNSMSDDLKCAAAMCPERFVEEILLCRSSQNQDHGKSSFSMISPALVASVMPSTWEAREKVLASLKKKIAQLEIADKCNNSI